jgi:hypothetical protein
MKESQIQDQIRIALGRIPGLVLMRNNSGMADMRGYKLRFGVGINGKGGADLIGWYRGRFVAAEIKTPTGRLTPDQLAFKALVERDGGIYVVLRSVDEALAWAASLERDAQAGAA